jgi:alpha-amylase
LALTYLYTAPGIPILYQGTEHMMDGAKDPDNRRMMDFSQNKKMETFTAKLGDLRQKHPALRRGDFSMIKDDGAKAVFKRTYRDETIYIVYNNDKKDAEITFKDKDLSGHKLVDLINEEEAKVKGGKIELQVKGETAQVFLLQEESSNPYLYAAIEACAILLVLLFGFLYKKRKKL